MLPPSGDKWYEKQSFYTFRSGGLITVNKYRKESRDKHSIYYFFW